MGENLFDGVQRATYNVVSNTMGYDASWIPSTGGPAQIARVLLRNPTETRGLGNTQTKSAEVEYNPDHWQMEYQKGDFPELKDLIDNLASETVTINSQVFFVRDVSGKFDGKTLLAALDPKR